MISFYIQELAFTLKKKTALRAWIQQTIRERKQKPGQISYIFCSDEHLLEINRQYLDHDTYTDIVTFDYSDLNKKTISGDIFISIDRVNDNAKKFGQPFERELHRVMIHGVLHLLGYGDKTKKDKEEMRRQEDACLKKLEK